MALAENQVTLEVVKDGATGPQGPIGETGATGPQGIQGPSGEDGKSAYESAVDGGYQGTEQDFNEDLGTFSDAVNHFWTDEDGAHVTKVSKEDFIDDPDNGGGNTLITSDGLLVRNGKQVAAEFGSSNITLNTPDGVPALKVESSASTKTQTITKSLNVLFGTRLEYQETRGGYCQDIALADANTSFTIQINNRSGSLASVTFTKGTSETQPILVGTPPQVWWRLDITYDATTDEILIAYIDSGGTDHGPFGSYSSSITYEQTTYVPQTEISGVVAFKNPTDVFSVTEEAFNYSAISSGGNSGTLSKTFSNDGYYPIGVVGFRTGNSNAVPIRCWLSARSSGQCTFQYFLRAVGAVSAGTGDVHILWVKE